MSVASSVYCSKSVSPRRLQNAIARDTLPQEERERHIRNSVTSALDDFMLKSGLSGRASVNIYVDHAQQPELETSDLFHIRLIRQRGMLRRRLQPSLIIRNNAIKLI